MSVERSFFEWVFDAFEGFAGEVDGELRSTSHRRGVKVWYGDDTSSNVKGKEHYEAQLIRGADGEAALEIGFHVEYSKADENDVVLAKLMAAEKAWRTELGSTAEAGVFLGNDRWRRISEVWEAPDPDDPEATMEIAARLADYVIVIEPLRRA